jgi:hypothetical protein
VAEKAFFTFAASMQCELFAKTDYRSGIKKYLGQKIVKERRQCVPKLALIVENYDHNICPC